MVQLFKIHHMPIVHKQFEEWRKGNGNNCKTLIEAQIEGIYVGVEMHFVPQLLACYYYKKATSILHTYASKSNDHNEQVNIFLSCTKLNSKRQKRLWWCWLFKSHKDSSWFFCFFGQVFQGAYHALWLPLNPKKNTHTHTHTHTHE